MSCLNEIIIPKPFDAHAHLRDGKMLRDVLPYTACIFPRAVVMGNLPVPIDTALKLRRYREEIFQQDPHFEPIMSVMLTREMSESVLEVACHAGAKVLKFIPGGTSTGGAKGLALWDLKRLTRLLSMVRDLGMVFSGHFELAYSCSRQEIARGDQEYYAIDYLDQLIQDVPGLKIVVEHASCHSMIERVKAAPANVTATLTAHHALLTWKDVYDGSGDVIVQPEHYCKPTAKTDDDRRAVRRAMVSGNPKFFFGSDSAPHLYQAKQGAEPAAGIFSAPVALPLLCQVFEEEERISCLEAFVSQFGPEFYGLPVSEELLILKKEPWVVPYDLEGIPIFRGGQTMNWKVV